MEKNPDKMISSKKDNKRNNIEAEVLEERTELDEVKVSILKLLICSWIIDYSNTQILC